MAPPLIALRSPLISSRRFSPVFPFGGLNLKSPVPFCELTYFMSQSLVLEPCVSLSFRMRRSCSHVRFALGHQELDIPIPTLELRRQILIFLLDCRKLFLQLSRGGRSPRRVGAEIDSAKRRHNEGMIFFRNKGGVQCHYGVILVRRLKREIHGDAATRKDFEMGKRGIRSFRYFFVRSPV